MTHDGSPTSRPFALMMRSPYDISAQMRDGLVILLTNIWLANRYGSEIVVRDIASGLLRRGHRPIVYSPELGEMAAELASKGIVVIDDLRNLVEPPDLIHAHHSIPCGEALIRFPDVPAIYVCHAFALWMEAPVHFPQIAAYVAVDEACRDRLAHAEGIDPARVLMLHNAVDLRRIPERPKPIADRPKRAVAFGKAAAVPELRAACERLGIEFDAIGYAADRVLAFPEQELVKYDLVFGSARAALEALCCGCAVVVCDSRGLAGLVTSDNFEALRARNFGLRTLWEPVTVERCIEEIRRYDRRDAIGVSQQARQEADLEKLLDEFERLYADVLEGPRRPRITPQARERAMARFLFENLPRRPGDTRWPWISERDNLQNSIEGLEARLTEASRLIAKVEQTANETRRECDARLLEASECLAKTEQASNEARRELDARLAEVSTRAATAERAGTQARQELEGRLAEAREQAAQKHRQLEAKLAEACERADAAQRAAAQACRELEAQLAAAAARTVDHAATLHALIDLKRSRMLKFGRLLRRITGRPVPY